MGYKSDTVQKMMEEYGKCLPFTIPGCYTLIYFNEKDEVLCSGCATKVAEEIIHVRTYDEGPTINCSDCGKEIESSYGEPEEEDEQ